MFDKVIALVLDTDMVVLQDPISSPELILINAVSAERSYTPHCFRNILDLRCGPEIRA